MDGPVATRCRFYRRRAAPGGYIFDAVHIDGPGTLGCLVTALPPQVGDRIGLIDRDTGDNGIYLVLERCWSYPSYGSQAWPIGKAPEAPLVEVIVEAVGGLFRDEVEEHPSPDAPA